MLNGERGEGRDSTPCGEIADGEVGVSALGQGSEQALVHGEGDGVVGLRAIVAHGDCALRADDVEEAFVGQVCDDIMAQEDGAAATGAEEGGGVVAVEEVGGGVAKVVLVGGGAGEGGGVHAYEGGEVVGGLGGKTAEHS